MVKNSSYAKMNITMLLNKKEQKKRKRRVFIHSQTLTRLLKYKDEKLPRDRDPE